MLGGLFFVPMLCLLGIAIALYRRDPHRFLDGPAQDAPLRLTPLGDSPADHAAGRMGAGHARRNRPHRGPVPPDAVRDRVRWRGPRDAAVGGRAVAGVWAMIVLAAGAIGLDGAMAVSYRLGGRPNGS